MAEYSVPEDFKYFEAISSIDGRYRANIAEVADYFSEKAVITYRIQVEVEFLIFLNNLLLIEKIPDKQQTALRDLYKKIGRNEITEIIKIDLEINHDTKSVEIYLGRKLHQLNLDKLIPYIHFGLTSADTDNNAISLSLKAFLHDIYLPEVKKLIDSAALLANNTKSAVFLGKTHGQPAVPTTMGKELINFVMRIYERYQYLKKFQLEGKIGGAVGNFNALHAAYPQYDWIAKTAEFISSIGLRPSLFNTQILPYDNYINLFQQVILLNSVLTGLAQDVWHYISNDYFLLKFQANEVGSSTMPQKVNPIDFEMAESYLTLANGIYTVYANKLTINRLQRDLTEKYLIRDMGLAWAATVLAYRSLEKGLAKLQFNKSVSDKELQEHWEVITEGIQTILRSTGDPKAFDKLKDFSRGKILAAEEIKEFIRNLDIPENVKQRLREINPEKYIGYAEEMVETGLKMLN